MALTEKDMLDVYETMILIRESESQMTSLYQNGKLPGHILPCLGQEAIPSAFSKVLKGSDFVVTGHRGGGHYIARGGDFKGMWAELYMKRNGIMKGKGGQMHLVDMQKNTIAGNAIVGATWVLGTGAGFAAKLGKKGAIVACFGGEGATNRGTFHEAINLAAVKKLPVIFVCENNRKQLWNDISETTAVKNIADRAASYDIPGITVDGNDPVAVYEKAAKLAERARDGDGPSILECKTFKWTDSGSNLRLEKEEVEYWKTRKDPVALFKKKLEGMKILDAQADEKIRKAINEKIEKAIEFGQQGKDPLPEEALEDVYSIPVSNKTGGAH